MELTVQTVIAVVVGAVVLIALVRGWYLTGRSLKWGDEGERIREPNAGRAAR